MMWMAIGNLPFISQFIFQAQNCNKIYYSTKVKRFSGSACFLENFRVYQAMIIHQLIA